MWASESHFDVELEVRLPEAVDDPQIFCAHDGGRDKLPGVLRCACANDSLGVDDHLHEDFPIWAVPGLICAIIVVDPRLNDGAMLRQVVLAPQATAHSIARKDEMVMLQYGETRQA